MYDQLLELPGLSGSIWLSCWLGASATEIDDTFWDDMFLGHLGRKSVCWIVMQFNPSRVHHDLRQPSNNG